MNWTLVSLSFTLRNIIKLFAWPLQMFVSKWFSSILIHNKQFLFKLFIVTNSLNTDVNWDDQNYLVLEVKGLEVDDALIAASH